MEDVILSLLLLIFSIYVWYIISIFFLLCFARLRVRNGKKRVPNVMDIGFERLRLIVGLVMVHARDS